MKLRSTIHVIALLLLVTSSVWTQSQYASSSDSDPAALQLMEQISETYRSAESHSIEFTLDMELPGSGMETQNGQLIQKGDKFVLDLGPQKIISDNETVWVYLKELNEVQINDADFEEAEEMFAGDFNSPSDIFNLYKSKDFVFAVSNYGNEEGAAITQIEGKPLDENSEYSKMRLTVINDGNKVKRLKIFSKNGSRFTLNILAHDTNYKVEESTFAFDPAKYEGVHVEDLRF